MLPLWPRHGGELVTGFVFQVSPQFQTSLTAAAPARRGRRRCQSATSILHSTNSVCKFPSLTFESRLPKQTPGTPRRQVTPVRRGNAARCSEGAASSSRCSIPPEVPSDPAEGGRTPDVLEEGRQRAPPRHQPPDILVADTPERDYGLKVTWRRRKDLMTAMKASGHLSDSDVLIHSSCSELAR